MEASNRWANWLASYLPGAVHTALGQAYQVSFLHFVSLPCPFLSLVGTLHFDMLGPATVSFGVFHRFSSPVPYHEDLPPASTCLSVTLSDGGLILDFCAPRGGEWQTACRVPEHYPNCCLPDTCIECMKACVTHRLADATACLFHDDLFCAMARQRGQAGCRRSFQALRQWRRCQECCALAASRAVACCPPPFAKKISTTQCATHFRLIHFSFLPEAKVLLSS